MTRFALGALLTVVALLFQARIPDTWVLSLGVVCLCICVALNTPLRPLCAGALVAAVLFIFALLDLSDSQLRTSQVSKDTRLIVQIVSVPIHDGQRSRFFADVIECLSCTTHWGPKRVQLSRYRSTSVMRAGEIWELTVRLKPIDHARSPAAFDRARWALSKGLHARGYIRDRQAMTRIATAAVWSVPALRERVSGSLRSHAAANAYIGMVEALTLGLKDKVDAESWTLLRETGTSHLLAISGLHVSLLAGFGLCLGRAVAYCLLNGSRNSRLRCLPDPHSLGLTFSLGLALPYALISGFELPVQRAIIMLVVWILASWRFRVLAPLRGLSLALLLVLMLNVLSPLSPGFWLSFGAVSALFYLHRGRLALRNPKNPTKAKRRKHPTARWLTGLRLLAGVARTHVLLGVALVPLTAWFFQSASLSAPLANLLAVPWVGFVVVPLCCLAVLVTALVPSMAAPVLYLAQGSLELLLHGLSWISGNIAATQTISLPGPFALLLCLLGIIILTTPRGLNLRWLAVPILLPALQINSIPPKIQGFEVHVLDVGQGLATLVLTRQHTLLYDTGGKLSSTLSQFEATVLPYLHSLGRRKIDTLIVSHGDEDHAFGTNDVLQRFPAAKLITGAGMPALLATQAEPCVAGSMWELDGVTFSVLHPAPQDHGSDNDLSCVLLVHLGASRVLLTGDIEKRGERRLHERLSELSVNLIIAPHHGSNTSSSEKMLDLLRPEHVVFAAGHLNSYGFPHADVQLRYKSLGSELHVTGKQGTIAFAFGVRGLLHAPSTWWESHRRFWHGIVNPACFEQFSEQALVLRLLKLSQKGQTLCGK